MHKSRFIGLLVMGLVLAGCGLLEQMPPLPPDKAPTELSASFGTELHSVILSWAPVERATSYQVFRAETAEGEFARIGATTAQSFQDRVGEGNQGRWYWYQVRACNAAGCGPRSEVVRGYAGRPPAPENVRATQGTYTDKIVISWDPVPGATHYHVHRDRSRDGDYRELVSAFVESNSVEDKEVRPATWYWYKVVACNRHGCSHLSAPAAGYCGPYPIPIRAVVDEETD
mgnify:FL=1